MKHSWVSFVAEQTCVVFAERDEETERACLGYAQRARVGARLLLLAGDAAEPCELRVDEQLPQRVRAFFAAKSRQKQQKEQQKEQKEQLLVRAQEALRGAERGPTRVVACWEEEEQEEEEERLVALLPGCWCLLQRARAPARLPALALRHFETGALRLARVPLAAGGHLAPALLCFEQDARARLVQEEEQEGEEQEELVSWVRVSRACMERPYASAHAARCDSAALLQALRALPAGAGAELRRESSSAQQQQQQQESLVLHWSARLSTLVLRRGVAAEHWEQQEEEQQEQEEERGLESEGTSLAWLAGTPLQGELRALLWGAETLLSSRAEERERARSLLLALLARRGAAESWPQLLLAPLARAAAWRALLAALRARLARCPALALLRPLLASTNTSTSNNNRETSLRLLAPPPPPPLRGGPLYAGLGLTGRPRFGGKDGE